MGTGTRHTPGFYMWILIVACILTADNLRQFAVFHILIFLNVGFKDSVQKRYIECKILPLAGLIIFYRSLFIYKYFQNCLPTCFKSMFELGSDIHTHSTRQSDIIRRPLAITRGSQFSIRHLGPHAWNCLPTTLRNMNSFF